MVLSTITEADGGKPCSWMYDTFMCQTFRVVWAYLNEWLNMNFLRLPKLIYTPK